MKKVKVYVTTGLGIGCHDETAHAYEKAGADVEIIHLNQLIRGERSIFKSKVLNISGGFLHGDIPGAGVSAANEIEHARIKKDREKRLKDMLIEYSEKGNIIYGQCNGFQVLVKLGLLPGIENDYSRQVITLTRNDCDNYRVDFVFHKVEAGIDHFAFRDLPEKFGLWCRHGEGKIQFYSEFGLMSKEEGESNRKKINENHVLLRYINPDSTIAKEKDFPNNPNGSVDGIAGLVNSNGMIFGNMAHPEVSVYMSRNPEWFFIKDTLRRDGIKAEDLGKKENRFLNEDIGLKIFKNIVNYFK